MNLKEIWGEEPNFKVFLSHKSEFRKEAAKLKKKLANYGISCFVAHNDVKPTRKWQEVIEKALESTDVLIALMTENFFESVWTNQEIGIARGREIPIIPIRLGVDPEGFIGHIQALTCDIEKEYHKIVSFLLSSEYKMVDLYITLVEKSKSWDESNHLAHFLKDITEVNTEQVTKLIEANNSNDQVYKSMGFRGDKTKNGFIHGKGLIFELKRLTGIDFSHRIKV